jgi:rhodanese-related sulfurtransferase
MQQLGAQDVAALCAGSASPVLLDVREPWEFALGTVRAEGATTLHIPMNEVPTRLAEIAAARTNGADAARPVVCI